MPSGCDVYIDSSVKSSIFIHVCEVIYTMVKYEQYQVETWNSTPHIKRRMLLLPVLPAAYILTL